MSNFIKLNKAFGQGLMRGANIMHFKKTTEVIVCNNINIIILTINVIKLTFCLLFLTLVHHNMSTMC